MGLFDKLNPFAKSKEEKAAEIEERAAERRVSLPVDESRITSGKFLGMHTTNEDEKLTPTMPHGYHVVDSKGVSLEDAEILYVRFIRSEKNYVTADAELIGGGLLGDLQPGKCLIMIKRLTNQFDIAVLFINRANIAHTDERGSISEVIFAEIFPHNQYQSVATSLDMKSMIADMQKNFPYWMKYFETTPRFEFGGYVLKDLDKNLNRAELFQIARFLYGKGESGLPMQLPGAGAKKSDQQVKKAEKPVQPAVSASTSSEVKKAVSEPAEDKNTGVQKITIAGREINAYGESLQANVSMFADIAAETFFIQYRESSEITRLIIGSRRFNVAFTVNRMINKNHITVSHLMDPVTFRHVKIKEVAYSDNDEDAYIVQTCPPYNGEWDTERSGPQYILITDRAGIETIKHVLETDTIRAFTDIHNRYYTQFKRHARSPERLKFQTTIDPEHPLVISEMIPEIDNPESGAIKNFLKDKINDNDIFVRIGDAVVSGYYRLKNGELSSAMFSNTTNPNRFILSPYVNIVFGNGIKKIQKIQGYELRSIKPDPDRSPFKMITLQRIWGEHPIAPEKKSQAQPDVSQLIAPPEPPSMQTKSGDKLEQAIEEYTKTKNDPMETLVKMPNDNTWMWHVWNDGKSVTVSRIGFKLHVSAEPYQTADVFNALKDVLAPYYWKVQQSDKTYADMRGTQSGKFITIYPPSDAESVNLAAKIDDILAEKKLKTLKNLIRHDNHFRGKSGLVYYTYTIFSGNGHINDPYTGEVYNNYDDRRRKGEFDAIPPWMVRGDEQDPFEAAAGIVKVKCPYCGKYSEKANTCDKCGKRRDITQPSLIPPVVEEEDFAEAVKKQAEAIAEQEPEDEIIEISDILTLENGQPLAFKEITLTTRLGTVYKVVTDKSGRFTIRLKRSESNNNSTNIDDYHWDG